MYDTDAWGGMILGTLYRRVPRVGIAYANLEISIGAADAQNRPFVVTHRGGALLKPESSISAFAHAVKHGADILGFDILMKPGDVDGRSLDLERGASSRCGASDQSQIAPRAQGGVK